MSMARFRILALGLGLSSAFGGAAFAQGAAASAAPAAPAASQGPVPTKIGVVNIQQAIAECGEGKKELDGLQQKFTPKQAELKGLSDDLESMKQQYQTQAAKLSDEEKNSRAKTIDTKQKALQRNYEDAQAEFQQGEQDVVNRIGAKMLTVLEKYATANGYALVMDVSNPQNSSVLWATQGTVITKELVDAYDKENPSGASAPATKPAGATGTRPATAPPRPATPAPTPKKP